MTNINLIRKTITGVENVVCDQFGNNTVAFIADLPKNALVTSVLVDGKHLDNVNNLASKVEIGYYRGDGETYNGKQVAAVLYSEYDGNPIVDAARAFEIESFVVEFIGTAIAEV
jgi:hypothetical protein